MIRLAVFDMAGTTVADDNFVGKAFRQAFLNNDLQISLKEVNPLMGYKKTGAIQMLLENKGVEPEPELVSRIHDEFENEMTDFYEYAPEVRPLPETEAIFLQLKERGVTIALNTGFSRRIAETIISRFQWMDRRLIDDYIASDEVEKGRPYPFMIQELTRRAGIDNTKEVAKIGDTEVDINEGRNAGCGLVIGVTTGAYSRKELEAYHPDHILDNLTELPSLLL